MTMQVGIVGTDGVLIASDTKWMNTPSMVRGSGDDVRHSFNSSKIIISESRGIAVSCARNMETARHVANKIISELKDEEWPILPIEEIGTQVLSSAGERDDAQCLIIFARPIPRLFLFQFAMVNGKWGPLCQKMNTKAVAGDNVNPAIFWAERYYQRRPIRELAPLAAQVIIAAGKLNPGAISGLEITLSDAAGIHRLSDESIRGLESMANELDESTGASLSRQTQ